MPRDSSCSLCTANRCLKPSGLGTVLLEAPENSFHTVDACVALEGPLLCLARLPDAITHYRHRSTRRWLAWRKNNDLFLKMPTSPRILSDHPPLLWQHSLPQRALSAIDNSLGQKVGFSRARRREGRLEDKTGQLRGDFGRRLRKLGKTRRGSLDCSLRPRSPRWTRTAQPSSRPSRPR